MSDLPDPIKGFSNQLGANNCFLNVVLQSFWHLISFRETFRLQFGELHEHSPGVYCLKCELFKCFNEYAFSEQMVLSPQRVRSALQAIYQASHRFDAGQMADALEAFENILRYLHCEQLVHYLYSMEAETTEQLEDMGCTPLCISHEIFGFETCDQLQCRCNDMGDISEVQIEYLMRIYSAELLQLERDSFGRMLGKSLKSEAQRCEDCGERRISTKVCISAPKVLSICLVWPSENENDIAGLLSIIQPVIVLGDLLDVHDSSKFYQRYILRGMICFYPGHYTAFFHHGIRDSWVQFDDQRVIFLNTWQEVADKMIRGRMNPVLVFYENAEILDNFAYYYALEAGQELDEVTYFRNSRDIDLNGLFWPPRPQTERNEHKKHKCVLF